MAAAVRWGLCVRKGQPMAKPPLHVQSHGIPSKQNTQPTRAPDREATSSRQFDCFLAAGRIQILYITFIFAFPHPTTTTLSKLHHTLSDGVHVLCVSSHLGEGVSSGDPGQPAQPAGVSGV